MRSFAYYLFEHFDSEKEANNPLNPRRFLSAQMDGVLCAIADVPAYALTQAALSAQFGEERVAKLLRGGIIRADNGRIALDTPVLVREDAAALRAFLAEAVAPLADILWKNCGELEALARRMSDPAEPKTHLYHVLCGMIFDGALMDALGERGAIAVERPHDTGLNYLVTAYESCAELDALSAGLLCSYNRAANDEIALQSFGDSDGTRLDAYRFFRLRELNKLPERFAQAERLARGMTQSDLLGEAARLLREGRCAKGALSLLSCLGYVENGRVCVPVYRAEDGAAIDAMARKAEDWLLEPVCAIFARMERALDVLCVRHGVSAAEIANELWHLLFGALNEEIVRGGLAARPPYRAGEGRYLQSIQMQWE